VILAPDGSERALAGEAHAALRALDLDGHQPVPHGLYAVVRAARAARCGATVLARDRHGRWHGLSGLFHPTMLSAVVAAAPPAHLGRILLLAHGLTAREREVAAHLLAGRTNEEIARALAIGLFTVKDHVKRVFAKTRTGGRAELAAMLGAPEP
jgi:DNA-binding CsgD family transcriptional regulator